jgi:hypothetical protein
MGQPHGQARRGGKKNRKHRRNYRWAGADHSVTKYRQLHHIAPGARRSDKR